MVFKGGSFKEFVDKKVTENIMGKKICIIMRGISGAGKSTRVNQLLQQHGGDHDHIFSTDNHWIPVTRELRKQGEYVSPEDEKQEYTATFDPDRLGHAHSTNFDLFKTAVDQGVSPVIVDNTNTTTREMRHYAEYAAKAGYEIKVEEPTSDWWRQYSPYLRDKKKYAKELAEFAKILHQRNTHGVPLHAIERMLSRWQPNVSGKDLLNSKD